MPPAPLTEPASFSFADDGSIPNNPRLPFLIFRAALDFKGSANPEALVEKTFAANKCGEMWRTGIYPSVHYHSRTHEVLGLARGRARVRFGGHGGRDVHLLAGDVCVLPAGPGHQGLWARSD